MQQRPSMGEENFNKLDELFKRHPEMTDMQRSPDAQALPAFHEQLLHEPYVQGLFRFTGLKKALAELEKAYLEVREGWSTARHDAPDIPLKGQEREVRFIMRMSAVLGPIVPMSLECAHAGVVNVLRPRAVVVLNGGEQDANQQELKVMLSRLSSKLGFLLQDEFFREDIASSSRLEALRHLMDGASQASTWLGSSSFRPVQRQHDSATSTAVTRQAANRLADASFRIYANCDAKILKLLLACPWLPRISPKTMTGLIEEALERKIDQFNRREPREEYEGVGVVGTWQQWTVSRDVNPPWMQDQ